MQWAPILQQKQGPQGPLVRVEGLEPPRLATREPKSRASTNSAIPAARAGIGEAGGFAQRANLRSGPRMACRLLCAGANGRTTGSRHDYGQKADRKQAACNQRRPETARNPGQWCWRYAAGLDLWGRQAHHGRAGTAPAGGTLTNFERLHSCRVPVFIHRLRVLPGRGWRTVTDGLDA